MLDSYVRDDAGELRMCPARAADIEPTKTVSGSFDAFALALHAGEKPTPRCLPSSRSALPLLVSDEVAKQAWLLALEYERETLRREAHWFYGQKRPHIIAGLERSIRYGEMVAQRLGWT